MYGSFEWDDTKARRNLAKHGVSFHEAATVFDDPRAIEADDLDDPERFVLLGVSAASRVLFVVHGHRAERVRIISARHASPSQRRRYEQGA
ncbi:MAG: BrnT family toxin [Myxococcales bacterium]|nr:BrnT family toxin [Myxococcales bacterium]